MSQPSGSVRQSLVFSFVERYGSLLISLVSTTILSRILTPSEIGVYSVAIAAIGLAQTLRDFGISNYLIQAREIDDQTIRTAMTASFLLSGGLGAILFALGPFLASYYDQAGIHDVVNVVCINMVLIPFGATLLAMLRREMRFKEIARINLSASIVGTSVSVACALGDLGFMSLAYGAVAGVAVTTLGAVATNGRLQWFKPSLHGGGSIFHFGGYASTAAVVGEINARIPEFTLAKTLNFDAVGMFGKAYSAVYLVTTTVFESVGSVFLPAVARGIRAGEDCSDLYCRSLNYVTAIVLPIYAAIMVLAPPMVNLLFGNQWGPAAPLATALACSAAVYALGFGIEHVLIASGQIRSLVLLRLVVIGPTLCVFLFVPRFGLEIVAYATIPIAVLYVTSAYVATAATLQLRIGRLLKIFLRNTLVAIIVALPAMAIGARWDGSALSSVLVLSAFGGAGTLAWCVALRVLDHELLQEINRVLMRFGFVTPALRAVVVGRKNAFGDMNEK